MNGIRSIIGGLSDRYFTDLVDEIPVSPTTYSDRPFPTSYPVYLIAFLKIYLTYLAL